MKDTDDHVGGFLVHRIFVALVALVALIISLSAVPSVASDPTPAATAEGAPDYSQAANWICRPGAESICTTGLDTNVIEASGAAKSVPFVPAADPAIDCFYVYPTISDEQTTYSDLKQTPEVQDTVNKQVGRLTSKCRVFAPVYRQLTIYGLKQMLRGEAKENFDLPMGDIAAAWASYLAHDNNGRGVVLVGHSQGTILLQKLIADTIEGTPQQKLIVSAFLAGDPSLAVPKGKKVGGTFAHFPVCSAKAQTGCAYAWGTYLKGDDSPLYAFGAPQDNGMESACEHPSAPSGGIGKVAFFHKKPASAPASDPPWIEVVGEFSGQCRADDSGNDFIVSVAPGPKHAYYEQRLKSAEFLSGWGLHLEDVPLALGSILDVLDAEIATWTAKN
jgi:hypothetical protein